ncbi:MAG: DUF3568 domain-containing protein [Candidatus Mariimomonas ferrooxydans]
MNKTVRLAALLSAIVFLYGCALALLGIGAGIGVGAYRYIEGGLERDYSLEYNSAWDATNTALANLSISVSDSVNKGVKGQIEAIRSDGKKIIIKLRDRGQNVTTINIRVGFLGSRKESERIHEEISAVAGLK